MDPQQIVNREYSAKSDAAFAPSSFPRRDYPPPPDHQPYHHHHRRIYPRPLVPQHHTHEMSLPPQEDSPQPERFVQPPRPPNAWILYRSDKLRQLPPTAPGNPRRAQAEVSKMISSMWKNETDAVRAEYERRADAKKAEHQQLYPGYRFQPMKKEDKDRIRTEKRTEKEKERSQSRRPRNRPIPYAPGNFTPPPLPPIIPVYQPQSHYGPTGPSPPLSAASSPEDDSPLREARPRAKSTSVSNNARPKSPLSSASPHDLFSSIPIAAPSPERDVTRLVAQRPPRNPQKWPTPHATVNGVPTERPIARSPPPPLNPPRNKVRYGAGNAQDVPAFTMPVTPQGVPEWPLDDELALQALLSATQDPSIFQLSNIDPQLLLAPPTGELEVSMGTQQLGSYGMPPPPEYTNFTQDLYGLFDFSAPGPSSRPIDISSPLSSTDVSEVPSRTLSPASPGADLGAFFPNDDDHQRSLGIVSADMLHYLNIEQPMPHSHAPTRPHPTHHLHSGPHFGHHREVNKPVSYQPPPGATKSLVRRAASNWKQSLANSDDESPLEPAPKRWGVSAN